MRKSQSFLFSMLSAKQGNYWYHFYNVFGMTQCLTGGWTRDLPHSKPALYHLANEEAVIHCNISIHLYFGCLHEIEIQIFKKYDYLIGWKNRLDTCIIFTSYQYSKMVWRISYISKYLVNIKVLWTSWL